MADKKMNELGTASDAAYIYAETSSGEQIRISKADLASVVAGLLGKGNLNKDINTIYEPGIWVLVQADAYNSPYRYGIMICITSNGSYPYLQILYSRELAPILYRTSDINKQWSNWLQV